MKTKMKIGDSVNVAVDRSLKKGMLDDLMLGGIFTIECFGPDGKKKWEIEEHNLITLEGRNHILNVILNGATQATTWYVGLKNTGTVAAGDTMSSHAGWTENTNYSESVRQTYTETASTAGSTTNSANTADFSINTDSQTIFGAFITSNSTKGGTTGTLLAACNAASSQAANDGDTIKVTYTITCADDGA